MATPYIMPLGFIDRITEDGAIFQLTYPEDSKSIAVGTPVTVRRYSQKSLTSGKLRGRITAVGYTTATFETIETRTDPSWPKDEHILCLRSPVFLAQHESFEPDSSRATSPEKAELLRRMASRYGQLSPPPDASREKN